MAFNMACSEVSITGTDPNAIWGGQGNLSDIMSSMQRISTNHSLESMSGKHFAAAISGNQPALQHTAHAENHVEIPHATPAMAGNKPTEHSRG